MIPGFKSADIRSDEASIAIHYATREHARAILLLHGFPQTHHMWRHVAPALAEDFTVVCADLRGYGRSSCPPSTDDHSPYSKRVMARELVTIMEGLGHHRFAVVGHDRGGRVAYRMALDHPERIERLAVLDIVPTATVWEHADARFALGFWPWSLLAQPEPLPEIVMTSAADAIVDVALSGWGSPAEVFPPNVRAAYVEMLRDPSHAHAICEEYRAAASLDREHDAADRAANRRIGCPVLALWSATGPLATWYEELGGPVGAWREWATDVTGAAVAGGHFFPEERPQETLQALGAFLNA
jgi:haloacetate dehalogenase